MSSHNQLFTANMQQLRASDPQASVYVNASAGSGKTKILIDRILRLMLQGSEISSILCLTFTNIAAEEILSRLKSLTRNWAILPKPILIEVLRNLNNQEPDDIIIEKARSLYYAIINNMHKINIQTLHAFALKILKIHTSTETNGEFIFEMITEQQRANLLRAAYKKAIATHIFTDEAKDLLLHFSDHSLFSHITAALTTHEKSLIFSRTIQNYDNVVQIIINLFNIKINVDFRTYLINIQEHLNQIYHIALDISQQSSEYQKIFDWLNMNVDDKVTHFDEYASFFLTKENQKRKNLVKKAIQLSPQDQHLLQQHQEIVLKAYNYSKSYIAALHNICFAKLVYSVFLIYEDLKYQMKLIDYDELLLQVRRFLSMHESANFITWILDRSIDHILVDEAQDLNSLQWDIINLLSSEFFAGEGASIVNRTIFIVGDHKQSIFRFQGAKPEIFLHMCQYYKTKALAAHQQWQEIDLNQSFRSGVNILSYVDEIFSGKMHPNIMFDNYINHISHRKSFATVDIIEFKTTKENKKEKQKGWQLPKAFTIDMPAQNDIGECIVMHINEWLQVNRIIEAQNRIIKPSDIMILFRKRGTTYNATCRALKKYKMPFYSNNNTYLQNDLCIQDIMSAARFVYNPYDDYNLSNLLKSPLASYSEEQILRLNFEKQNFKQSSIWVYISHDSEYQNLFTALQKMILEYNNQSIYCFMMYVLQAMSYSNSNALSIQSFLDVVLEFENAHYGTSIYEFIQWFDAEQCMIKNIKQNQDAVQLSTIHSAKGLEASVVILADLYTFDQRPRDQILWYRDVPLLADSLKDYNQQINQIKEEAQLHNKQDNLRLLYVALTRARDEIYIVNKDEQTIYNIFS